MPLRSRSVLSRGNLELDARPRDASKSGEMGGFRFSASGTVLRLLQPTMTREHDLRASDPRPLRRWGALSSSCADALSSASRSPLSRRAACDSAPPSGGAQAASHATPSVPSTGRHKLVRRWGTEGRRSSTRRCARAARRSHRRSPRGWVRQRRSVGVGRLAGSEGTGLLERVHPSPEVSRFPSSVSTSRAPLVTERRVAGEQEKRAPHDARPRSPLPRPPRRGARSRQSGCFPPP